MKKKILAVIVEGGLVQGLVTNSKALEGLEFMVIDYDTDGADDEMVVSIKQNFSEEDHYADAYVYQDKVGRAAINLEVIKEIIDKRS